MTNPKSKTTLTGYEKRTRKRNMRVEKIIDRTTYFIKSHLKELQNPIDDIDEDKYESQLSKLFKKIQYEFLTKKDIEIACKHICKHVITGNNEGRWALRVPITEIRYQEPKPLRDEDWFIQSNELNQLNNSWLKYLSETNDNQYSESTLLASILTSAAFNGGLCSVEQLVSLANLLISSYFQLEFQGNRFWSFLEYTRSKQANNDFNRDEERVCVEPWYIDTITLSWIYHFLFTKNQELNQIKEYDEYTCWDLIKTHLEYINGDPNIKLTTFKRFCNSSIGVTENIPGVCLTQVMVDRAVGRISNSSLIRNQHFLKQLNIIPNLKAKPILFNNIARTSSGGNKIAKGEKSPEIDSFINEIWKTIPEKKTTQRKAIKDLTLILQENKLVEREVLIKWLLYKLGTCEVSSVRGFFSRVGKNWLYGINNLDMFEADSFEFEMMYDERLSYAKNTDIKNATKVQLSNFHEFGESEFEFPPVSNLNKSNNESKFVRTAFVPEHAYIAMCNSTSQIEDIDELSRISIKCLIIVAYRTGLRRGELLKLKLMDIEQSLTQWSYIRENEHGNNKTISSLRKVPLRILLTKHEVKIVKRYILRKKISIGNNLNCLAFSITSTPSIMFDKANISFFVKDSLKKLMGLDSVFHDLRHTALSKIHVILENNTTLIREITNYSTNEISKIQRYFGNYLNNKGKDIYWSVAGIAGHATPESTFESYLHFLDVLIGDQLIQSKQTLTSKAIINICGISKKTLSHEINKEKLNKNSIPVENLRNIISKKIRPYCQEIKRNNLSKFEKYEIELPYYNKLSIDICWSILNDKEKGIENNKLAKTYKLKLEQVEALVNAARNIASPETSQNNSRLFPIKDKDKKNPISEYLAPRKPAWNVELKELSKKTVLLQKLSSKFNEDIQFCIDYFTKNKIPSSSSIIFSNPKEFKRYISLILKIYPKNRLKIVLSPVKSRNTDTQIKKWMHRKAKTSQKYNYTIKIKESKNINKDDYPFGELEFNLQHPDSKKIIEEHEEYSKFNTNILAYIFHMFAIMDEAEIDYQL